MLSYVKKRSGELNPFDAHKLRTSISRAMKDASHKDESQKVLTHILNKISLKEDTPFFILFIKVLYRQTSL